MNPTYSTKTQASLVFLVALALACFALVQKTQAVSPPPDGGYPGGNTAEGQNALFNLTIGLYNTAIGHEALYRNANGQYNTATGYQALYSNTYRFYNTAVGAEALSSNTDGGDNTAIGAYALFHNATGDENTAIGFLALASNTSGFANTADGSGALRRNTTGYENTADGIGALNTNTTGYENAAMGAYALVSNRAGYDNTASGANSLSSNTGGYDNTATGAFALFSNTGGRHNTANGSDALYSNGIGSENAASGYKALYSNTGSNNVGLGSNAGSNLTTGSGNVCIGAGIVGLTGENNTTRIRNVYASASSGRAVYVNSDNKIGTLASTRRVKQNIKAMDKGSEAIFGLRPVSFRYKPEIDASGTRQFGLIAEEVADINADLVTRDAEGKPETVRYDQVNAMLLNEFLKEHRKVEQQQATIRQLESTVARQRKDFQATVTQLTARLDGQAAQIRKVSAQLETSKPAAQVVNNP